MITLIANDDTRVLISVAMARHSPYIMDAFWDEAELDHDQTLEVLFATGAQLQILKQVLEAKEADGSASSFIPAKGTIQIGELPFPAPAFVVLKWMPALNNVMSSLSDKEIIDLLILADYMCMRELRAGIACLMLYKIVSAKNTFVEFFSIPSKLTELVYSIYKEQLNQ